MKKSLKENWEVVVLSFWAGTGFWTASRVVREVYILIEEGF